MKPLTRLVVEYIESEGVEVKDWLALEIPDNVAVASQDPLVATAAESVGIPDSRSTVSMADSDCEIHDSSQRRDAWRSR